VLCTDNGKSVITNETVMDIILFQILKIFIILLLSIIKNDLLATSALAH